MQNRLENWRTQEDSNLWPLPSEGLSNSENPQFCVNARPINTEQAGNSPVVFFNFTGATPECVAGGFQAKGTENE